MEEKVIDSAVAVVDTLATAGDSLATAVSDTTSVMAGAANTAANALLGSGGLESVITLLIEKGVGLCLRILLACLIFAVGKWIISRIKKVAEKIFVKRNVDQSLASFLRSLINIVLMFILIICIIGVLGIETSSFVALFASAGVAIGMALSGTLQNFAGGVMILLFKPFKIGDFIEAQGNVGTVKEIQIFNTIINTVDNKMIIVPNGGLSTSVMINYSKEEKRRVDFVFGVAYGTDYDYAKSVLLDVIKGDGRILADPAPFIALNQLNSSSVDIVVRVWVKGDDYWGVYFDMNEKVYKAFAQKQIEIPFPQVSVHMKA